MAKVTEYITWDGCVQKVVLPCETNDFCECFTGPCSCGKPNKPPH
jgi:hypothetical protein